MNKDQILRKQIVDYLIENPINRKEQDCYRSVADKFGTDKEYIRRIYRTLRENGQVEEDELSPGIVREGVSGEGTKTFKENVKAGLAETIVVTAKRVTTLNDLVEICEIDLNIWNIDSWECNKWEVGRRDRIVEWRARDGVGTGIVNDSGKIFVEPLFQVKAKLSKRKVDTDLQKQKEIILAELKTYSPVSVIKSNSIEKSATAGTLLEISIPDLHYGKLSWREETGEDYDIKIAEKRFSEAISSLLERVNLSNIDRILFPIGNDLINIDNRLNTTTAGTLQDTDCRFMKIIKGIKRILVETICKLSVIAPVDVVIVPGNHDMTSSFMVGEILEAWFHNHSEVVIDNAPKLRKYYKYGKVGIQLTHGNEEKHHELGMIFAAEEKHLWADTDYHFCQLGHFHKNKKINWVSVDEFQGFQVQVMPSLSGTDFWHKSKGYNSNKAAKAFLFDHKQGLIGEFTHNIPK